METKEKKTAEVESEAGAAGKQTETQQPEARPLPETTVEHLHGEIARLADKVFEVNPDAAMGGEHGGAVDVACIMLNQLKLTIEANQIANLRVTELEDALAKAKADNDNADAKIAKLEAGIAPVAKPAPQIEIKRPKIGAELKFAKKPVKAEKVIEALEDGDLFQVVLADTASHVLPVTFFVGGQSILAANGVDDDAQLTLIAPIEIDSANPSASVREAWLLDVNGVALSKCRLAVDLVGGGGLTAAIPAKAIVFRFEQPAD